MEYEMIILKEEYEEVCIEKWELGDRKSECESSHHLRTIYVLFPILRN